MRYSLTFVGVTVAPRVFTAALNLSGPNSFESSLQMGQDMVLGHSGIFFCSGLIAVVIKNTSFDLFDVSDVSRNEGKSQEKRVCKVVKFVKL